MKKLLLLIVLSINCFVSAQNTKVGIKGRILDESNLPLPGATITINSLNIGGYSDYNGYYEILGFPKGTYEIEFSFIGYQNLIKTIKLEQPIEVRNISLNPKVNGLQEVIIRGSIARGQAKALNQQRNRQNISNIVSSDQIGKFGDANIGDALKRVPGISMQNDQGEARDIIIRGMAPQLNSITLNGDKIPSAEGDSRRVQMDLIPSEMIQLMEVNKVVSSDMEGDAIGGSVNLITRSAPAKFKANLSGSYGLNPVRETPNFTVSALVADRVLDKKLGYVINTTYNSNEYGSDNVEFEWASPTVIKEHDIRKYDVKRNRMSVATNLDLTVDPFTTLYLKSLFTQRDDLENRYRVRYKYDEEDNEYKITRQTKGGINDDENKNTRLERQSIYKVSVGGKHIIFDNIKLNWKTGISRAKEVRPNERYITYQAKQEGADVDFIQKDLNTNAPYFHSPSDFGNNPNEFKLKEISQQNKFTKEWKRSSNLDITIPINASGKYKNSLKFGLKNKYKEKMRDNIYYEYDTDDFSDYKLLSSAKNSSQTNSAFFPGKQYKSGLFATNEFLGGLNLEKEKGKLILEEFVPENYNSNENVFAFYGLLKQNLSENLSITAGLRAEKTNIDYKGFSLDVETAETMDDVTKTKGDKSFIHWLPSVQGKYKFTKNTILKAGYTHTIARPNYYDLVPYRNLNSDDLEGKFGNPNLEATTSVNYDLMFEHYFDNVGILSGGAFYKNLDNFIYESRSKEDITVNGATEAYDIKRPFNGGVAQIYGFEFAVQRKLNFLPGFLRNLNIYGNYTLTNSKTDGIVGREDGLALTGAVKNMFNGSLAYETKKVTVRASFNYADDYIDEYGKTEFEDRYYDTQSFLDVSASYAITKKLRIFAEAKNLTNQELRFYQGSKNQTMQSEYYNYNWNAGLKYNF